MSQPVQVDSEISFNTNAQSNTSHSQHSIDLDQTDAVSAFRSDHGRRVDRAINTSYGTEEGALHQQITNMANLLQDVVQELKSLKSGGSGNSHQTAPNNSRGLDSGFKPYHTEFQNDRRSTATVAEGDGDFNHLSTQPPPVRGQTTRAFRDSCYLLTKMQPFNGENEWSTWIAQFEAIARRKDLSENEMLDQLLPRLEGQAAQFVFTQLPPMVLDSYQMLKKEMDSRFRTIETARSFASKFSRRSQRQNESLEEYAADLKRLYDKAHGYRSRRAWDEDSVRRFLEGLLDDELKFELEFNKEPANIDEAVY